MQFSEYLFFTFIKFIPILFLSILLQIDYFVNFIIRLFIAVYRNSLFLCTDLVSYKFARLMVLGVFLFVFLKGFPTCFNFVKYSFLNHNLPFNSGT